MEWNSTLGLGSRGTSRIRNGENEMKFLFAATVALLAVPAHAQTAETCLTQTVFGQEINPPMCFVPESIAPSAGGDCEVVIIPSGGTRCVNDRPAAPTAGEALPPLPVHPPAPPHVIYTGAK